MKTIRTAHTAPSGSPLRRSAIAARLTPSPSRMRTMPDEHSVRAITEGQQRWLERIWARFGTPFEEPRYGIGYQGCMRVALNGFVFVVDRDTNRCHLEWYDDAPR